jgi:hypothetical protein
VPSHFNWTLTQTTLQIAQHIGGEIGQLIFMVSAGNIKRRNANWIGYVLRGNCLLKHVIDGKRGVVGGRDR